MMVFHKSIAVVQIVEMILPCAVPHLIFHTFAALQLNVVQFFFGSVSLGHQPCTYQ